MKIKMRVHISGDGFAHAPGDEVDRPDDEAIRLIKKGYAAPLTAVPMERAVVAPAVEMRPAAPPPATTPEAGADLPMPAAPKAPRQTSKNRRPR